MVTGAGSHATFYNRYYNADGPYSNNPSGDKLMVKITSNGYSGGHQLFTAKITATCKTLPAVTFSWKASDGAKGVITLKDAETTELGFDDSANIDLYQQSCYINSSGSILGSTSSSFASLNQSTTS